MPCEYRKCAENCALQESTNTVEVTVEVWKADLLAEYRVELLAVVLACLLACLLACFYLKDGKGESIYTAVGYPGRLRSPESPVSPVLQGQGTSALDSWHQR